MFLNPFLLFGLTGIAAPIAIHLLARTPPKPVRWAAMRFLRVGVEKHKRRLRVEDLILLILRCLIIALLALALARPTFRAIQGLSVPRVFILLDDSMSMSRSDGATRAFDSAKAASKQLLDALPAGSKVALWRVSDTATPVLAKTGADPGILRAAIDAAEPSDRNSDLNAALVHFLDTADLSTPAEVYLFTDGQQHALANLDATANLLRQHKDKLDLTLVLTKPDESINVAVTDVHPADGIIVVDRPTRFIATVTNLGKSAVERLRVSLCDVAPSVELAKAKDDASDQEPIDRIEPGQSKSVALVIRLHEPGTHAIEARIDAVGGDGVADDDRRVTVVTAAARLQVLLVDGDRTGRGVDADSFYLKSVLIAGDARQKGAIDVRVITPTQLDAVPLTDIDLVAFVNVPDCSDSAAQLLRQFVDRGGGLLIFAGDQLRAPFYNDTLGTRCDLLPATLGAVSGDASDATKSFSFDSTNLDHPIAALWRDDAGSLNAVKIRRRIELTPRDATRVVLDYADGKPAIVDAFRGRGYVCLFSTTADTSWTDLPVKPGVFVPLVYRAVGQALERRDEGNSSLVGRSLSIEAPAHSDETTSVMVAGPYLTQDRNAKSSIATIDNATGRAMASWTGADRAGIYEIGSDAKTARRVAIQFDPAESDLRPIAADALKSLNSVVRVVRLGDGTSLSTAAAQQRQGVEWSLPLLTTLLGLLVVESLLAGRFSRAK